MLRISLLCLAGALAFIAAGCTSVTAYRTSLPNDTKEPLPVCPPLLDSNPDRAGSVPEECAHKAGEQFKPDSEGNGYDLYFVEFDDQGWLHRRDLADKVLNRIREDINGASGSNASSQLLIVTYVHGWKHDTRTADSNVRQFRLLLHSIATQEKLRFEPMKAADRPPPPPKVVGLYIGWRGGSLDVPGLDNLTFWDRKKAAEQVAQGSIREFVSRIDVAADIANTEWYENQVRRAMQPAKKAGLAAPKPVRTLFIGHSFGGHILFTAFSGSVIRDLAEFQERYKRCIRMKEAPALKFKEAACDELPLRRQGDLLILLNPAIEGLRYEPLHVATSREKSYPRYAAPIFVSVTSEADTALSFWFRIGRFFSTMFEAYPDDPTNAAQQREANELTLGSVNRYLTHSLCSTNSTLPNCMRIGGPSKSQCPKWDNASNEPEKLQFEREENKINREKWIQAVGTGEFPDVARHFCGGTRLVAHASTPRYSPIWNIRTDGSLIPEHTKIVNSHFIAAIRQIFADSSEAAFAVPKGGGVNQ